MDSQEKTLELGNEKNAEVTPAQAATNNAVASENVETTESTASNAAANTDDKAEQKRIYKTKAEVVERINEIAHAEDMPQKDEVEYLKTTFYKLHFAERDAEMKAYLNNGGDPAEYQVMPDADEEAFKNGMAIIKERRAKQFEQQEKLKQDNLQKKLDIIEKIKTMVTSPEEANKAFQDFKELQQQWKEIKLVPAEKANELWRNYQLYVEQFYDLLKLNSEAREYDFKKNLEAKTKLCEAVEKLADEEDIVAAYHRMQDMSSEYREIGPVAKEHREEIRQRFKAASTVINKKHQQYFDDLRAKEEENLNKKTALCEKVEEVAKLENKNSADWESHSKQIIEIQAEWKTIGFAPQKVNVKIFERFRTACDDFFKRKSEYFTQLKKEFNENAEKKKALVEKAQALKDSTDWKSTSDKFIALQKEWKSIGMVPKKYSDQLWNDFLAACNHFFEARNAATAGTRNEQRANLEKKREVIAQLKAMLDNPADDTQATVRKLTEEYNAIGHVPFKEKDKLYKEYHEVLDKVYKELHVSATRRRLDNFKSNLKDVAKRGEDALSNERIRLQRRAEQMKQEIQTYENNLGFLNVSSKKGNSLIDEMNRKVEKLKDELELLKQKIKAINTENK